MLVAGYCLVEVHAIIVTRDCGRSMIWLRIGRNGSNPFILCLILDPEFKNAIRFIQYFFQILYFFFTVGGFKNQFPDTLSNNVDAKNVSSPTDTLNNKKTTEKPTITHSKCLISKHTIKDFMNNQRDRINSNRVVIKTSNTRKLDSFVCNSSKQRTTRSGIVQSMATNGQRSIKSVSPRCF